MDEPLAVKTGNRSQSAVLRFSMGAVFIMLGLTQFIATARSPITESLHDWLSLYLSSPLELSVFAYLLGTAGVFFGLWLWSGRLARLAGTVAVAAATVSMVLLFVRLQDSAWDRYPFLLNANMGQTLIKDVMVLGIGLYLLFEKRR